MSATVSALPVWKKDSTAAEWLGELASMAMQNPERWARIIVVYEEASPEGYSVKTRWLQHGIAFNSDIVGTLETAKQDVIDYMRGRL